MLSLKDKITLLTIARDTLFNKITRANDKAIDESAISEILQQAAGAFVSLHRKSDGKLQGCMGSFKATTPLYKLIKEMVISAALRDHRFSPLSKDELENTDIEISVLSPMKEIKTIDEIELGKHGIYIIKNHHSGTFLPQVALLTGWSVEEFLGRCAIDKAGIGWEGWKEATIYTYEAEVFSEKEMKLA